MLLSTSGLKSLVFHARVVGFESHQEYHMALGGSQQSRQPVTLEIAGSAPVGVAIRWHHSYVYVSAQAVAQKPLQKLAI